MPRCRPHAPLTSLATLMLAVALVACDSNRASDEPPASASSPSDDSFPEAPSNDEPSRPTLEEQAIEVWEAFHTERLDQLTATGEPDPSRFEGLATEDGTEAVIDLIVLGRGDVPFDVTDAEFWPEVDITAGADLASISDCVLVAERPEARPDDDPTIKSQVWTGKLTAAEDSWRVDQVSPGIDNCIPPELNRQLLDAYLDWNEAKNQWWDPPDSDHPQLDQMMTGAGLKGMQEQLDEHHDMGIAIRDTHDPAEHAVVDDLGIGSAWITDCYPAESGSLQAHDQQTGELREDLTPPPTSGQHDRVVVNLERTESGVWKVEGWRSGRDANCEPGETPYVSP